MDTKWYTLRVQTNKERVVSNKIQIEMNKQDIYCNTLIPIEKFFYVKNGKQLHKDKMIYPGYLFIETNNLDELRNTIRNISGHSGLLKDRQGVFLTLKDSEIQKMTQDMVLEKEKEKIDYFSFSIGEEINIKTGIFTDFKGLVEEVFKEKEKLVVSVPIFGKRTNIDLDFVQVEKIKE